MNIEELDYILLRINRAIDEISLVMNIVSSMGVPYGQDNVDMKIGRALGSTIKVCECIQSYKKLLENKIND